MNRYRSRKKRTRNNLWTAGIAALIMASGMFFGQKMSADLSVERAFRFPFTYREADKLERVIRLIQTKYVDQVDMSLLERNVLSEILQHLDPHSQYISASEFKRMNANLEGRFDGIGVEFRLMNDTTLVVSVTEDGPADRAGIKAGDKIVMLDSTRVSGAGKSMNEIAGMLRGPKGTVLNLKVRRYGEDKTLQFAVERGTIPLRSVEVAYMLDEKAGYIKINKFAATTHKEFLLAFASLKDRGMENLVLDLRNNGGGYLSAAVALADEFLDKRQLIVYTHGYNHPREDFYANAAGVMQEGKLTVILNERSASASEILAGALQDLERATIVGRRSFGKGLVQSQTLFPDGSALRLTVARYFTPLGRSIQKPYDQGVEAYYSELQERLQSGELYADSLNRIFPDSLKVSTESGKILYGGGGIMPDVFVPVDTAGVTNFYRSLYANDLIYDFTYNYIDQNMSALTSFESLGDFVDKFVLPEADFNLLVDRARRRGVRQADNIAEVEASAPLLTTQIKALIARRFWGERGFYKVMNERDTSVQRALEEVKE